MNKLFLPVFAIGLCAIASCDSSQPGTAVEREKADTVAPPPAATPEPDTTDEQADTVPSTI